MKEGTKLFGLFISIFVLIGVGFMGAYSISMSNYQQSVEQGEPPASSTTVEITSTSSVSPSIKEKYDEIIEIPYVLDLGPTKSPEETLRLNQGDCDDRAVLFADWLYSQGYRDIYIVMIDGPYVETKHAFLVFNDGVYDLGDVPKYNWSIERTKSYFTEKGYTIWKEYKYYPGIWGT